jgi:hypothetical protein
VTAGDADQPSVLTLTGWSAIAGMFALAIVVVGGAVLAWRRYLGLDKYSGYTMVVKGRG